MNALQLKKMLNLAQRTEVDAARRLAQARETADACRRQLDELNAYRERPTHFAGSRIAAVHFAQANRFFGKVDEALHLQSDRLKTLDSAVLQREVEWTAARGERRALEKLLEGAETTRLAGERRAEQKQLDEAASHAWLRKA